MVRDGLSDGAEDDNSAGCLWYYDLRKSSLYEAKIFSNGDS